MNNAHSSVKLVKIDAEFHGQRIDNFLINYLKAVPKSRIYRLLRKGEIRVNKGRIKPHYRLQTGDLLRLPPISNANKPHTAVVPPRNLIREIENKIIYEDKLLLIINKPSGLAVHGGSGISLGAIEIIRALRPEAKHLELVHRLDKDTSGCLIVAKKRSVLRELHELFRSNIIEKNYLALVQGKWKGKTRVIDLPLTKNILQSGERIVVVDQLGKKATSIFKPLNIFDTTSLIEVALKSGRTHQIRVHAQAIGTPIAGDQKYGDDKFNRAMRSKGLKRLFLHAHRLKFKLSHYPDALEIFAGLDLDLQTILDSVRP